MIQCGTWETGEEIRITYPRKQRNFYEKKDSRCIYDQFERQVGINKPRCCNIKPGQGCFQTLAIADFSEMKGYRGSHFT